MLLLAIGFMAWIDPMIALVAFGFLAVGAVASALVLPGNDV